MMNADILALDASTSVVGWCIAADEHYIDSGVFVPSGANVWERLESFKLWLNDQLAPGNFCVLVYEEPCGDRGNRDTDRKLGALMGVAFAVAGWHGVSFVRVNNATVRATGVHKGATREAVWFAGRSLNPRYPGDEADAIGVWLAFLAKKLEE